MDSADIVEVPVEEVEAVEAVVRVSSCWQAPSRAARESAATPRRRAMHGLRKFEFMRER